ncbi:MAG: tRNA (guanosine(37)-N1)-methyltransferase TrmD [Bacteroidales bacterium]|nr:tRNA (guanosine(37)-N1)-methyltransferase TrmD [Bacteroidales bacterium]
MRFDILTVHPELLESPFNYSIIKRAVEKGIAEIGILNIRDFSKDKHKKTDDYAFGGGAGMVMTIQPIADAVEHLLEQRNYDEIIYLTPDGIQFNQGIANNLSTKRNLMLICGHYKGIDQRIRDKYVSMEISIGDYVLTGGELAAAVVVDSVVRIIPGAISDETSALSDSFQDNLLSAPVYSRPSEFKGMKVPEILLSGNTAAIEKWRMEESLRRTKERRPDLL